MFLALPIASAPPPTSVDTVFDALQNVTSFHSVAISPDGSRAAWSEKVRDAAGAERLGRIRVGQVAGGPSRPLSASADGKAHKEKCPVFSPDSRWIAFLSDAGSPGQVQVSAGSGLRERTAAADPRRGPARRSALVSGR